MLFTADKLAKRKDSRINALTNIDPFSINFDEKHYEEFTDAELVAVAGETLVFDCEVYWNYFIVAFKHPETKRVVYFEDAADRTINYRKLDWILHNCCLVGFNSRSYDVPLVTMAMMGHRAPALKEISNRIIFEELHPLQFEKEYQIKLPTLNHIDLIEVAPLQASLKMYAGRLHCQRMQELPIDHNKQLTELEAKAVKLYCINDLDSTVLLLEELTPALNLRVEMSKQYGEDLRSKSDAQIAESVITTELRRLQGYFPKKPKIDAGTSYLYKVPHFIQYQTPQLQQMLELVSTTRFVVEENGSVGTPEAIEGLKIKLGECVYRMGIGGLHSSEECVANYSDEKFALIDKDVTSYYPSIILNLGLAPKHLGKNFLTVYRDIVNRRIAAKQAGNKVVNESLKITINGSFGKLGSKYSALYSPDLLIQVTMTGQLSLLMLIELLEQHGFPVISANTDGIVVRCERSRYTYMEATVIHWQKLTGFETEETRYKAMFNRDVNNYIAIGEDGKVKVKGVFAEVGSSGKSVLSKNPEHLICNDAVIAFLTKRIPVEETVANCHDIRRFVTIRNVKGGAEKSGVFLGRAVRWYYSKKIKGEIVYVTTGNKVPKSENAMPLMELPEQFPDDVDHAYYVTVAKSMLDEIGYGKQRHKQSSLF